MLALLKIKSPSRAQTPLTKELCAITVLGSALLLSTFGCAHRSSSEGTRQPDSLSNVTPSIQVTDNSPGSNVIIDPTYVQTQADYYYAMGEAYSLDGAPKKAIESFKSVLVYDPDSLSVRVRLAHEYVKAGLISEALEEAQRIVEKDPNQVEARLLLGGLYSAMKMYPKAMNEYQRVIKIKPERTEAYVYLAAIYAEQKKTALAIQTFKKLLEVPDFPNPHLVHYYMGRVYLENKQTPEGMAALSKSNQLKPQFLEPILLQAQHHLENSQSARAEKVLRDFHLKNGPREKTAEMLAQIYLEQEKYDEAFEMLTFLEENGSEDVLNVKLKVALIMVQRKMYSPAASKLEEILTLAPDSDKVRFYLGAVYEELENSEKALKHFNLVPSTSSFYEDSLNHVALILRQDRRERDAVDRIEAAFQENGPLKSVIPVYVSLLESIGELDKAAQFLSSALKKEPRDSQLRFLLGSIYDRLGKKEDVISQMRIIIEAEPNHAQALNFLAYTFAELGTNLEEAEKLALRAVRLEPKDPYIVDTLGWVYFKQNRHTESMKTLEAAYRLKNDVSIIAEHLGDVYMKVALTDRARKMYMRAMSLETDPKKLEQLQSKVTAIEGQKALIKPRAPASIESTSGEELIVPRTKSPIEE